MYVLHVSDRAAAMRLVETLSYNGACDIRVRKCHDNGGFDVEWRWH